MSNNRVYYLRDARKVVFNPSNGETFLANRGCPLICIVSERDCKAGVVKYGYAILHKGELDTFSKAAGREEAAKKLSEDPLVVHTTATTGHEINKSIVQHFYENVGKKNNRARKLSKTWLRVAAAKANAKKELPTKEA